MRTYSGKITSLEQHQVFVFGSNTEGRHGSGAAKFALENFGAVYGVSRGFQGSNGCYAIVTKDLRKKVHPSVSKEEIEDQIRELYNIARVLPDQEFFIAYSGYGYNLNGYTSIAMARMFAIESPPDNVVFEEEFAKLVQCSIIATNGQ